MNVILIYDITEGKSQKVKKECNKYLNWVQNSVFEGEVTEVNLKKLLLTLKEFVSNKKDSIIIYKINSSKWIKKEILGIEKNNYDIFV